MKTGEKYSSFKDENEILQECSLSDPKLLTTIMPPFDKDNEIYIWINNRCRRDFTDIMIIDPNTKKVKIKDDLLITIWGHCGFSFNPNGPIYGYSVNIDELYEKYISKDMPRKNDIEYIDEDGYLHFDSLEKFNEFKTEFEHISYYGNNIDIKMFPGILHDDTQIYKAVNELPNCEIHRFILFTKNEENESDINKFIEKNNGLVENSVYGIYKNTDNCYGDMDGINIYNCITFVIDKFSPYYYEKKYIGTKCIFSKTEMNIMGKYCGSLGMMIEKLKSTIGAKVFNQDELNRLL